MTDHCVFVASDQPRVIRDRHLSDCEGDCDGCLPCLQPHCRLDGRTHLDLTHPQTCPECVGTVRDDLTEIRDLCIHLRERALTGSNAHGRRFAAMRLPGGDPLVMLGPVSDGSADVLLRWADTDSDDERHNGSLELPGDPDLLLTLATWEDDWSLLLIGHRPEHQATVGRALRFLGDNLTWASQRHDAFDEFAKDMRWLRRHLEDKLADGERPEVTQVPCLNCGTRLVKVYGRWESDDHHACLRCKRVHRDGEFERAKRQHLTSEDAETWILLTDAARSINRSVHTMRTWVNNGKVRTDRELIEGVGGVMTRVYVWWPDVRHADALTGRRNRSA